jgi:hypothetical protein
LFFRQYHERAELGARALPRRLVCSDAFDHTSLLRFMETRFGVGRGMTRHGRVGMLSSVIAMSPPPVQRVASPAALTS